MELTCRIRTARRRALTLTIALACSAGSALAQSPSFLRTDHPFLGNDHTVGDFNGDGRVDLAGIGLRTAAIRLGIGDGSFQATVESVAASVGQVQALAPSDFDRDGFLDLMVTINVPTSGCRFSRAAATVRSSRRCRSPTAHAWTRRSSLRWISTTIRTRTLSSATR